MTLVCLLTHAVMGRSADAQNTALPTENVAKLEAATVRFSEDVRHDDWADALDQLQRMVCVTEPSLTRLDVVADPLGKAIIRCFRAVHHRDRSSALHAANKIRLWATLETAPAPSGIAQETARLGFLARELQIDLEEGNDEKAADSIAAARQCWDRLKPMLGKHGDESELQEGESIFRAAAHADAPEILRQDQAALSALVEKLERELGATKH